MVPMTFPALVPNCRQVCEHISEAYAHASTTERERQLTSTVPLITYCLGQ
jgi:hypothetical protein